MFISTAQKQSMIEANVSQITNNSSPIQISTSEKLLAVTVDSCLTWNIQIERTIKECNSLLYLLGHIKRYLNLPLKKVFFSAYILPHLVYYSTVWSNCSKEKLDHIIKFQKGAAHLILDKDIKALSDELFQQ